LSPPISHDPRPSVFPTKGGSCPGRLHPRRRTHNVGCYGPRRRALHPFPSRKYRQLPGLAVKPRPWRVPERPHHSHLGCRRRNWPKGILLFTVSGPLMSQVCCHVHGIYPYCYIEYKGNLIPDDGTPWLGRPCLISFSGRLYTALAR
jgi:hypothetical protein